VGRKIYFARENRDRWGSKDVGTTNPTNPTNLEPITPLLPRFHRVSVTGSKRPKRDISPRCPQRFERLPIEPRPAFHFDFKGFGSIGKPASTHPAKPPANQTNSIMNILQRYQPALSWGNEFDRFFDRSIFRTEPVAGPREAFHESDTAWILRLDLPGYNKADVSLTVTDRVLQLDADSPAENPFGGKLQRQWKLGSDIDATAISARLENGVLELTLPKKPEVVAQPTTIEIN
jgi:HSP20 family protein